MNDNNTQSTKKLDLNQIIQDFLVGLMKQRWKN